MFDQVFYYNVCTLSEQVFDMKYVCASFLHVCFVYVQLFSREANGVVHYD